MARVKTPTRLDPVKARSLPAWPTETRLACDHAGLLLLLPAMVDLDLPELVRAVAESTEAGEEFTDFLTE